MGPINYLPTETHLEIQNYLDKESAVSYSRVNHAWNLVIGERDMLWKTLFPEFTFSEEMKAKKYLDLHAIGSKDNFFKRIEKFTTKVLLGQTGIFTCHFPYISNGTIELTLHIFPCDPLRRVVNGPEKSTEIMKCDFIFMKNVFDEFCPTKERMCYGGKSFFVDLELLGIWHVSWNTCFSIRHNRLHYEKINRIINDNLKKL